MAAVAWCKPRTSIPDDGHRKYPCLLRHLAIDRPDQVWCTDITYVPMPRGHAYLCAVMDWHSCKVLGWALSNTMGTDLCLEALERARDSTGRVPEIFSTDQSYQFTSANLGCLRSRLRAPPCAPAAEIRIPRQSILDPISIISYQSAATRTIT